MVWLGLEGCTGGKENPGCPLSNTLYDPKQVAFLFSATVPSLAVKCGTVFPCFLPAFPRLYVYLPLSLVIPARSPSGSPPRAPELTIDPSHPTLPQLIVP